VIVKIGELKEQFPDLFVEYKDWSAFDVPDCAIISRMADENTGKPESKYAEVIRKGKEKRAGMDQQTEKRTKAQEETRLREEADQLGQAFNPSKDSETQ
jgi:hypothetical protein